MLSKYRSGKLPKAFKIIPALSNWEQILYVTDPEAWTAAAMYQATRLGGQPRHPAQVRGTHGFPAFVFESFCVLIPQCSAVCEGAERVAYSVRAICLVA